MFLINLDYIPLHVDCPPTICFNPTHFFYPDNFPEPGKRPLSSTAPTIIEHEDGSFYLAIGGSGGSRIFPAIFQVLLNLEWGLDISSAIEFGRLHNQLYPLYLDADDVYPPDILRDLEERGHDIKGQSRSLEMQPEIFIRLIT